MFPANTYYSSLCTVQHTCQLSSSTNVLTGITHGSNVCSHGDGTSIDPYR